MDISIIIDFVIFFVRMPLECIQFNLFYYLKYAQLKSLYV